MLVRAEFDAEAAKQELASEREVTKKLESDQAELVGELYDKTVELGIKTALLERRT